MNTLKNLTDSELMNLSQTGIDNELSSRGYVMEWHKPLTYAGVIYVLVNPAFPDLVKIGYADNLPKRLKTLNSNSGLPDPFHCYATYKVKKRLEDLKLHELIDDLDPDLRHRKGREFYETNKERAYKILRAIAQINGDEEQLQFNPLDDPYFKESVEPTSGSGERKPRLTFASLGIPIGSVLVFKEDESITVTTIDAKSTVEMTDGTRCKLSAAVRNIKNALGTGNASGAYQGGIFFSYKGEILTDMRARLIAQNASNFKQEYNTP